MNVVIVGLSHKTAPVEIREKVAFSPTAMEQPLHTLVELPDVNEGVIVSTCNRVELYAVSRNPDAAEQQLRRFFSSWHELDPEELEKHLYAFQGEEAIRHVYRVSASLDSMVIGEPQILGQIKTAYGYATEFKTAGIILNRLLHKAFSVAKRVRNETEIASNAVSVSFAAVELARKIFDTLEDKTVLLIGAGEMCELAAKHFVTSGVPRVLVTNRTLERAEKLAEEFNGRAIPFETFPDQLDQADIVLTSTGAPDYILSRTQVDETLKRRRNRPMFFIDIAVPRDIDPAVNKLANVYLYDVDDLQGVVQANLKQRQKEAKKAEAIIDDEIGQFYKWLSELDIVPTIVALRKQFDEIRRQELEKTLSKNSAFGDTERKALEGLTNAIINKLLHVPIPNLKRSQDDPGGDTYVDAVRALFELPEPGEDAEE
ncbi:MAG: glutamyl-tRNA reductase [Desulfuromonas sp.]|nr:MAG: glutamyl-tRNA reductase [Desulfuromonas sp.]